MKRWVLKRWNRNLITTGYFCIEFYDQTFPTKYRITRVVGSVLSGKFYAAANEKEPHPNSQTTGKRGSTKKHRNITKNLQTGKIYLMFRYHWCIRVRGIHIQHMHIYMYSTPDGYSCGIGYISCRTMMILHSVSSFHRLINIWSCSLRNWKISTKKCFIFGRMMSWRFHYPHLSNQLSLSSISCCYDKENFVCYYSLLVFTVYGGEFIQPLICWSVKEECEDYLSVIYHNDGTNKKIKYKFIFSVIVFSLSIFLRYFNEIENSLGKI